MFEQKRSSDEITFPDVFKADIGVKNQWNGNFYNTEGQENEHKNKSFDVNGGIKIATTDTVTTKGSKQCTHKIAGGFDEDRINLTGAQNICKPSCVEPPKPCGCHN